MIHKLGESSVIMTERASLETEIPFFFSAFDTSSILLITFIDMPYVTHLFDVYVQSMSL